MKIIEAYGAHTAGVLAVGTGETGANNFLNSTIGTAVIGLCGAVGVIVAVVCIFRMIKHVTNGKPGEGFKVLVFGLMIGGLLFNLNLTISGAKEMGSLVQKVFDSAGSVTG